MLLLTEVVLRQVGICGRTGAGKSSFVSAFFRLTDVQTGAIRIDGYDIGTMSLRGVRSSLAIIPQVCIRDTPYVFLGVCDSRWLCSCVFIYDRRQRCFLAPSAATWIR